MSKTIYLAIIDEEILFRKGIIQVLQETNNMELLYEVSKGKELINQLQESNSFSPDVILIGLRGENKKEVEEVRKLSSKYPESKLITLCTGCNNALLARFLEIGVAAHMTKNATPQQIENGINMVVEKGFFYNERVLEVMRENMITHFPNKASSHKINLSEREKDVLKLICEQYTNTEIAQELNLSTRTVEWHRVNLLRKLKCRNTAGLVAIAVQQDLVQVDFSKFNQ